MSEVPLHRTKRLRRKCPVQVPSGGFGRCGTVDTVRRQLKEVLVGLTRTMYFKEVLVGLALWGHSCICRQYV